MDTENADGNDTPKEIVEDGDADTEQEDLDQLVYGNGGGCHPSSFLPSSVMTHLP